MIRVKTFDATGLAPNGVLFAGDLNAMQDAAAALTDFTQAISLSSILIGDNTIQLFKYGAGEARLTGAIRTDGIIRALGGLYAGAFTSTQRDAIAAGFRPFGLVVLNTTTNRLEINLGSDSTPSWSGLSASIVRGTLAGQPGAGVSNANSWYFATDDNGGTLYYSDGTVWTKVSKGLTEAPVAHASSHLAGGSDAISWITINGAGTLAARPAAASTNAGYTYLATDVNGGTFYRSNGAAWAQIGLGVTQAPTIADSSLTPAKIAGTAVITSDTRLSDQRVPVDRSVTGVKLAGTVSDNGVSVQVGSVYSNGMLVQRAGDGTHRHIDHCVISLTESGGGATGGGSWGDPYGADVYAAMDISGNISHWGSPSATGFNAGASGAAGTYTVYLIADGRD